MDRLLCLRYVSVRRPSITLRAKAFSRNNRDQFFEITTVANSKRLWNVSYLVDGVWCGVFTDSSGYVRFGGGYVVVFVDGSVAGFTDSGWHNNAGGGGGRFLG